MTDNQTPAPVKVHPGANSGSPSFNIINKIPRTTRSPRRRASRHLDRIEIGGGIIPSIKCSRKDLGVAVLSAGVIIGFFFLAKEGSKRLFSKPETKSEDNQEPPIPPKVERFSDSLNSGGEPKVPLIPDILYPGGRTVIGGRTGVGKSLLIGQLAVELARGHGEFVSQEKPHRRFEESPYSIVCLPRLAIISSSLLQLDLFG